MMNNDSNFFLIIEEFSLKYKMKYFKILGFNLLNLLIKNKFHTIILLERIYLM